MSSGMTGYFETWAQNLHELTVTEFVRSVGLDAEKTKVRLGASEKARCRESRTPPEPWLRSWPSGGRDPSPA